METRPIQTCVSETGSVHHSLSNPYLTMNPRSSSSHTKENDVPKQTENICNSVYPSPMPDLWTALSDLSETDQHIWSLVGTSEEDSNTAESQNLSSEDDSLDLTPRPTRPPTTSESIQKCNCGKNSQIGCSNTQPTHTSTSKSYKSGQKPAKRLTVTYSGDRQGPANRTPHEHGWETVSISNRPDNSGSDITEKKAFYSMTTTPPKNMTTSSDGFPKTPSTSLLRAPRRRYWQRNSLSPATLTPDFGTQK